MELNRGGHWFAVVVFFIAVVFVTVVGVGVSVLGSHRSDLDRITRFDFYDGLHHHAVDFHVLLGGKHLLDVIQRLAFGLR